MRRWAGTLDRTGFIHAVWVLLATQHDTSSLPLGGFKSDFLWCPPLPSSFLSPPFDVSHFKASAGWETTRLSPSCLIYFILPKITPLLRRNTMETLYRRVGQALISQIMSVSLQSDATVIWRQKTGTQIWFNTVFSHNHSCHTHCGQRNLIFRVISNIYSIRIWKL